jgi:hypothetical protein
MKHFRNPKKIKIVEAFLKLEPKGREKKAPFTTKTVKILFVLDSLSK